MNEDCKSNKENNRKYECTKEYVEFHFLSLIIGSNTCMDLKESMKVCQNFCWIHFVIRVLEIKFTMEIVIYEKICTIT